MTKKIFYKEGIIKSSLYKSAKNLNIEDSIIVELANLYGFQIDFQRDIYKEDSFEILYEKFINEEEKIVEFEALQFQQQEEMAKQKEEADRDSRSKLEALQKEFAKQLSQQQQKIVN